MTRISILMIVLCFPFFACKQSKKDAPVGDPSWKRLSLPLGWSVAAPNGFVVDREIGLDSQVGYLWRESDSISFNYDIGVDRGRIAVEDCSVQKIVERENNDIKNGFYKEHYKLPEVHTAYIDTINGMIATIVKPVKTGKGTVRISISDCYTGAWMGLYAENLKLENEQMLLKIFSTIKLDKQKINEY